MTIRIILCIFLIAAFTSVQGQEKNTEFGKISDEEFEMIEYEPDKEAEAVVLYDIGKSDFFRTETGFDVIFERTVRIKILSEAGMEYAEFEIPFYQHGNIFEKVYDIEAYTYNLDNGQKTRTMFDMENSYTETINEYWKQLKFAMPEVRAGSIIECKYKVETQDKFNLQDWEFQKRIPVIYSKYIVRMVPFYEYTYILQGVSKFDEHRYYEDKVEIQHQTGPYKYYKLVHEYVMKDLPAFNDEEFITSINDHIIKMDFQLAKVYYMNGTSQDVITSWDELIKDLNESQNFGRYIKKSEKTARKVIDIETLLKMPERERFDDVIYYLKNNYRWNGNYGKYANKSSKELVEDGFGSVADLNLFAVGLLRAVDIDAYPMISSTRQHGSIRSDYPISSFFNYVMVHANIDGESLIADVSESLIASDRIPTRCLNDKGLIIDKEAGSWASLGCNYLTKQNTFIEMLVGEEEMETKVMVSGSEYQGLRYRKKYGNDTQTLTEEIQEKGYEVAEESVEIENYDDITKPYIFKYNIHSSPDRIGDKIYISPFMSEVREENPLKQADRRYPIDMVYPYIETYNTNINIPEGYELYYCPKNQTIRNDLFELEYKIFQDTESVSVSFSYCFKKAVYSAKDYIKIKLYFNDIVEKGNDKIILQKTDA